MSHNIIPEQWGAVILGSLRKKSVFTKIIALTKIREQPFFGEYRPKIASKIKVRDYGS